MGAEITTNQIITAMSCKEFIFIVEIFILTWAYIIEHLTCEKINKYFLRKEILHN